MSAQSEMAAFPEDAATLCDAALLQKLMALPSMASVLASPSDSADSTDLQVVLATKDVANNSVLKMTRSVMLRGGEVSVSEPMPMAPCSIHSRSPSGTKSAIVRPGKEAEIVVEVWEGGLKVQELVIPAATHGAICADSFFGHGLRWSPCECYLAYAAERPKAKADVKDKDDSSAPQSLRKGIQLDSVKREDWGELNTKKQDPKVYVLDIAACSVREISGQQQDHTYGQPMWTPGGGLILVCWPHVNYLFPHLPIRLGSVYCFNRPCSLLHCAKPLATDSTESAAGEAGATGASASSDLQQVVMQPPLHSAMEPRFSPDGETLVFISHQQACEEGTHNASALLHKASWAKGAEAGAELPVTHTEVTKLVENPGDDFPGLYSSNLAASLLPEFPFLDNGSVILNTQYGVCVAVVKVALSSGTVTRLTPKNASYSFLCTTGTTLVGIKGCLDELPCLCTLPVSAALGAGGAGAAGAAQAWAEISGILGVKDETVEALIAGVQTDVIATQVPAGDGEATSVESLLYSPEGATVSTPTALFLHGGPHSAVGHAFLAPLLFLLASGYRVVLPNFRGSSGYGGSHLLALPGAAGQMDVNDCKAVVDDLVAQGSIDGSRVAVVGGSHGGFLTGHLLGQFPGAFTCGVMRNPVLDVRLMVHVSDIPDWCFIEALGPGKSSREAASMPLTPELAEKLHSVSPIAHVHGVNAPVLMFLGAKDRRVPMADGTAYSNALRCLGKPVKIHEFAEDTHALDKPLTGYDQWLNIVSFFNMHTAKS